MNTCESFIYISHHQFCMFSILALIGLIITIRVDSYLDCLSRWDRESCLSHNIIFSYLDSFSYTLQNVQGAYYHWCNITEML
uniref:Uncharacterized protein n=1 Tax=Octopus bimaculoides TaxID=37653 RepID=A0A0L8GWY0_OCTBM